MHSSQRICGGFVVVCDTSVCVYRHVRSAYVCTYLLVCAWAIYLVHLIAFIDRRSPTESRVPWVG